MKYPLIGLTGLAGAGKSTVAQHLWMRGYERHRFAETLKAMIQALLMRIAPQHLRMMDKLVWVNSRIDGADKETALPLIHQIVDYGEGDPGPSPITARYLMQTLGTEWGRKVIHPNFWVHIAMAGLKPDVPAVFDDVRFPNEADAIRARGGLIVRIVNPRLTLSPTAHVSEQFAVEGCADYTIVNSGTLSDLRTAVDAFLYAFGIQPSPTQPLTVSPLIPAPSPAGSCPQSDGDDGAPAEAERLPAPSHGGGLRQTFRD